MNQKYDLGTIIGLVSGATIIATSVWWLEGEFIWFFQWSSVFIVIGGVLCATLVNYPLKALRFNRTFSHPLINRLSIGLRKIIDEFIKLLLNISHCLQPPSYALINFEHSILIMLIRFQ